MKPSLAGRRPVVHGQQIPVLQNASHRPSPPIEVEAEGEESGARGAGEKTAAPRRAGPPPTAACRRWF
jgi:hypothetical protein